MHSTPLSPSSFPSVPSAAWQDCARVRTLQRRLGAFCAVLLAVALLAVADGVQGLMRSGADVLDLLPGQDLTVSGPAALKNPVDSDLQAAFDPPDPSLTFHLDGFFTGYWMGNGMWRARVAVGPTAEPGRYGLLVRFRGAPPSTDQRLTVQVYADEGAMRAASLSLLQRLLGWNSLILAASLTVTALVAGVLVFALGSRYQRQLAALGCGEVLRVRTGGKDARLWCLLLGARPPAPGTPCAVLDPQGRPLGVAVAEPMPAKPRGVLELSLPDQKFSAPSGANPGADHGSAVRSGCLVRLRSQRPRTPPATGR